MTTRRPGPVVCAVVIYAAQGNLAAARNLLANQPRSDWRAVLLAAGLDVATVALIIREDC